MLHDVFSKFYFQKSYSLVILLSDYEGFNLFIYKLIIKLICDSFFLLVLFFFQTWCNVCQPPGEKIYHKGTLAIFEIDSSQSRLYCQNLSLLGKLFLEHKQVVFGVKPYIFYILCEIKNQTANFIGYFSKVTIYVNIITFSFFFCFFFIYLFATTLIVTSKIVQLLNWHCT